MSQPLENYTLIGDGQTAALGDGSIDWLCLPRFDSDACFAALLGAPDHGRWFIGPTDPGVGRDTTRAYRTDTLILETKFVTSSGTALLIDFMPMRHKNPVLIRIVVGLSGRMALEMDMRIRFDYGSLPPWMEARDDGFIGRVGPDSVRLYAPVPVRVGQHVTRADFTITAGERRAFVLNYGASHLQEPENVDAEAALAETDRFWRGWIGRFDNRRTCWPEAVRRSLVTLKAMIYQPTGGIIAAPTTSLPEAPGGAMNWDYRYCWLRDSTFTLSALLNAGYHEEAVRWRDWLLRAIAGSPSRMRIMYRVDGGRHLDEWVIDWLPGYRHALPVRVGNSAATQSQLDVWGEVLDSLRLSERSGLPASEQALQIQERLVEHIEAIWTNAGSGLWESRGEPRHYTYSKTMAWVGVDRFLSGNVSRVASSQQVRRLTVLRQEIHNEICHEAWNDGMGSFTQYYGGQTLDASVLLMPLVGFLSPGDSRMESTIAMIRRTLTDEGLVRRTAAGLGGTPEGAFLACSFWMADCLALQGKVDEAKAQFERVLAVRNDERIGPVPG
jgi:GH15 family glucan-1,4-alpha-glucosidase